MDLIDIGRQIRAARKEQRLTQADLAARSGVSRARIDALENGRAGDILFRNVESLLNAVGLDFRVVAAGGRPTLDDLMEEEDGNAPRMG